jgi:hypothetical protein
MKGNFYLEILGNFVGDAYAILRRHQIISVFAMTTNVRPLLHPGPPRNPSPSAPLFDGRAAHSDGFRARIESSTSANRLPNGPLRFAECRGTI